MSGRSRRHNPNTYSLDYGELHRTGQRVYKPTSDSNLEMDSRIREKQIADDLNESFLLFSLDELESPEEIRDGLESIGQTGRDFRHIHILLKEELGEDKYAEVYVDFEDVMKRVRQYQKDAKSKLRTFSKMPDDPLAAARLKMEKDKEIERKETEDRVRRGILIEENVFREKLDAEIADMDRDDLLSIEKYCVRFELLLDNYYALLSKAKVAFSNDYDT